MVAAVAWVLVAGCGGREAAEPRHADKGRFVEVTRGKATPFEALVRDLRQARVVYVGEEHDQRGHHQIQAAIIGSLDRSGGPVVVGMEMFERRIQPALDDWVDGRIEDEATLLRRTEWETQWGFDFDLYRPIFELARQRGIRLIALNAPRELVRQVARGGLESLSDEQRAQLPPMQTDDDDYRAMIARALEGHPNMGHQALERFIAAQRVWDETMAQTVAEVMRPPDAPARMVVLAGVMHVRAGLGIPRRAAQRGAEPYRIVLPLRRDETPWQTPEGRPVADYVWVP